MVVIESRHIALVLAVALSGCASLAPKYERPATELPASWASPEGQSTASVDAQWWKIYGDLELDRLVEEALAHNAELAVAVARVDEARALLRRTRSDQFPTIDADVKGGRNKFSEVAPLPIPPGTPRVQDSYRATLNVSYEVDLWGRLHDATKAARAELLATEAARETVQITLAADVVQGYFALRALDQEIAATQRSLATRTESLALQKVRYDNGLISEFEYRQREAEVAAARVTLPVLERQRAIQENALAVLLGKSPKAIYEDTVVKSSVAADIIRRPPALVVPAGLPSQLLLRRPDLVEAEQRLIANNALIGVARSAYFPSLTLTGYRGSESTDLSDLFTGPAGIWGFAASLAAPIWAGGRIKSQVEAATARQRQALVLYQQTIQNAFRDVRDAIVAQNKTREQFNAENERVAALQDTLRLATERYTSGVANQLDVLDAERNLLAAELNRADALRAQRAAIADLFKALGGGWGTNS